MRPLVLLGLVLVIYLPLAYGLKCHSCASKFSDLDCFRRRESKECYEDTYTCGKKMYKVRGKPVYERGCVIKSYCVDQDAFCRQGRDRSNCEVYCCNSKECNTGARKTISNVLLVFSALVALLFHRRLVRGDGL